MPPLVRRYLKTAIGFLLLGLALGVYMPGDLLLDDVDQNPRTFDDGSPQ